MLTACSSGFLPSQPCATGVHYDGHCLARDRIEATFKCPGEAQAVAIATGDELTVHCVRGRRGLQGGYAHWNHAGVMVQSGWAQRDKRHGYMVRRDETGAVAQVACFRRGEAIWQVDESEAGSRHCP